MSSRSDRRAALVACTQVILPDPPPVPRGLASPWAGLVAAATWVSARAGAPPDFVGIDDELAALGDEEARAHLALVLGESRLRDGDLDGASFVFEEAEPLSPTSAVTSRLIVRRALIVYLQGDLWGAMRLVQRGYGSAAGNGHRLEAGIAASYLANYAIRQGSLRAAERYVELAQAQYRGADDLGRGAMVDMVAGWIEILRGQWRTGERLLRDAEDRARAEDVWFAFAVRCTRLLLLAEFLPDETGREVDELLPTQRGNAKIEGILLQARASSLLAQGSFDHAVAAAAEALEVNPSPFDGITGQVLLARAQRAAGHQDDSAESAQSALDLADRFGCTYWSAAALVALADARPHDRARLIAEARCFDDGDEAFQVLLGESPPLRIRLDAPVGVWSGTDQVVFAGRQAELTTLLLAVAGEDGIEVGALADQLWPSPDPGKLANRMRTLLWQVRRGLGADAWRLVREDDRLVLDCRNADLTWPDDGLDVLTEWPHISAATRSWLHAQIASSRVRSPTG